MANVKNFGLIGVGSDLQFGKAGTRLINNLGVFNFKAANGSTDSALTAAGITSSAGDVTLTTGNLVLSATDGTVSVGGDTTLSRASAGVFQFNGTKAFIAPTGDTAARPTGVTGMIRVNNEVPAASSVEFYNGTTWSTLATGGDAGELQDEVNRIETSLGGMVDSTGLWVNTGLSNATVWPTAPTDLTSALNTMASMMESTNSLEELLPVTGPGNVIYANATGTSWLQAAPGSTSGVQAYDAGLSALAAKTTTGFMVQTGDDTYTNASLVAPVRGFTITNDTGTGGNPTFVLANNLAAIESLSSANFGYVVITADGQAAMRQFGAGTGIAISNEDGVTTNTDISLAELADSTTGTFLKITRDVYGRVSGTAAVATSDITALVDNTYVNLSGDTMSLNGSLTFNGGEVLGLPAVPTGPTAATSKAYVDNMLTGLQWKNAVDAMAVANVALTQATMGAALVIDTVTIADQNRVLLVGQTTDAENGIYVVTVVAGVDAEAGLFTYSMARAADVDVFGELKYASVFVAGGAQYTETGWTQTNEALTSFAGQNWVQFSGGGAYTAGSGVSISGTTISTVVSDGLKFVDIGGGEMALTLDIASGSALNDTGGPLALALASAGGLEQTGGELGIKATGVTNDMLVNSGISLNGDFGTGTLALGGTLIIEGTSAQGISTTAVDGKYTLTIADATVLAKGVASFNTASFSVTSGAVSLNTVDVAHGGTGATTLGANQVLVGNGTSPVTSNAGLTYVNASTVDTLTLGGANGSTIVTDGTDITITATSANGSIVLTPSGTGTVVIGPAGSGSLQSDAGTPLQVIGNTTLTLSAVTGNVIVNVPTTAYVDVTGPTAAQYAASIASVDTALTNKKYVDDAIIAGTTGAIKSYKVVVPLDTNATVAIGSALPAGATVLSVKVVVGVADSAATLSVGKTGSVAAYMTAGENDTQTVGMYVAETFVTEASSVQVNATVASTGGTTGSTATVIFTYQVA